MKNTMRTLLALPCLYAIIFLASGCKKDTQLNSGSESTPQLTKSASLQKAQLTACEEEAGVTMAAMEPSIDNPDGFDGDGSVSGTADDITKVVDWIVSKHTNDFWWVTSYETITYKKVVPANPTKPYKMTGITHNGSDIGTTVPLPMSWTEGSATPYYSYDVASMRVTGNVFFCGMTLGPAKNGYKIFTL